MVQKVILAIGYFKEFSSVEEALRMAPSIIDGEPQHKTIFIVAEEISPYSGQRVSA